MIGLPVDDESCNPTVYSDSTSNSNEKCGIALANFLFTEDQSAVLEGTNNIMVHTIGFAVADENVKTFLRNVASAGGGDFYDVSDATGLEAAFKEIIRRALRDNAGIALPGISINRFNKRFHSDKAYYAIFKPSLNLRWEGNLKKYKLGQLKDSDGNNLSSTELLDATGEFAADSNGIKDLDQDIPSDRTAISYWSENPDGKKILEGGAGEELMLDLLNPDITRKIYTVCGGNTVLISDSACTSSELGLVDDAERTAIVSWLQGEDVHNEYTNPPYVDDNNTIDIFDDDKYYRWAFGDSLHSSPRAVTYGSSSTEEDDTTTKLFIGSNDGMLRMINTETGKEEWAFVPKAMINPSHDGKLHAYGLDSTPVVWINDPNKDGINATGDFVKLYIGMRRGGRNLYGLDVTDITTPKPTLDWVIEGGLGDFTTLGQTWSAPMHVKVNPEYCTSDKESDHCDVLIFGGGYDIAQDGSFGPSNIGNAIYMVNANTGKLEWWASNVATTSGGNSLNLPDMTYPIPANLKLLDTTGNHLIDRIYVGDLGGQVWRIDLDLRDTNGLMERGGLIANISSTITSDKRRFFNGIAHYEVPYVGDLVMIVSGRVTLPMSETSVNNNFYAILDEGWKTVDGESSLTTLTAGDLENVTTTWSNFNVENDKKGWYLNLTALGEKGTATPTIGYMDDDGDTNTDGIPIVLFTTFIPPSAEAISNNTDCSFNEGTSELYALNILTSGPAFDTNGNQFDDTKAGNEASDRSIKLNAPGMSAGVQIVTIDDGTPEGETFGQTTDPSDAKKMILQDTAIAKRLYWRQVEE